MIELAASILAADFAHLADDVALVERGGATLLHVDIMDGHFVPNITFGPPVVKAIRPITDLPLDCHLMIEDPDKFIPAFAEAGADYISFHPDASTHVDRTLQLIRNEGCKAGLVFNPAAPIDVLEWVIDKVDLVLVMSVNPGFGGQSFIDSALRKIEKLRKVIDASGRDIRLEVDGGIKAGNIRAAADAGADTFVAGSAIFSQKDYALAIAEMRAALAA